MGMEQEMLRNQVGHLEDKLSQMRESTFGDSSTVKTTLMDQQRLMDEMKENFAEERRDFKER
jgi:hypothetical protein